MIPQVTETNYIEVGDSLFKQIHSAISNDWYIVADDTHRWVETDGWYELQFEWHNYNDESTIYIHTQNGDSDLQEAWSEDNPQDASITDVLSSLRSEMDYQFPLERIIDTETMTKLMSQELIDDIKSFIESCKTIVHNRYSKH